MTIEKKIEKLKKEKNAIILAHYYQLPEIQEIADFIGDSLALSQYAANTNADIIIFAGVNFMAETAKILNPQKKVIIPDTEAGCSLADSCKYDVLADYLQQHGPFTVISYINCSSSVKTLSDVICTSSNAVKIVESFPKDERILFVPDKNLGSYINGLTGRQMTLWNGSCEIHDVLNVEAVLELKMLYPKAKILAHPECRGPILEIADHIGSTTSLLEFSQKDSATQFIVATETGIIHQMKKKSPHKEFLVVPSDKNCACNDCPYMKLITLEKIYNSLLTEKPEIILDEELMNNARKPIVKMLQMS